LDDISVRGIAAPPDPKTRTVSRGIPIEEPEPTGPHKMGGQWYKKDGTRFTTAEILAGKHLERS